MWDPARTRAQKRIEERERDPNEACIHVYMYICIYVYMYLYICIYVYMIGCMTLYVDTCHHCKYYYDNL